MIALQTTLSSYIRSTGIFVILILALSQSAETAPDGTSSPDSQSTDLITTALQGKNFELAERAARKQLSSFQSQTTGSGVDPSSKNDSTGSSNSNDQLIANSGKRKALITLATVMGARAWDADLRSRSSRLSGSDILILVVVTLLAGGLVALLMRYGPQRPKVVGQVEQWVGKMESQNRDDGFKQAGIAMYSLLILGFFAGGLFLVLYGLIHLVAGLDSPAREDPAARRFFNEAKTLMSEAETENNSSVKFQDYDVLNLYSSYLRKTGDQRLAVEVDKRSRSMQICGPGQLSPRTGKIDR